MRFGDLCSFNRYKPLVKRIQRYWEHVARQGFSARDPVYRYFGAWDIFHDSEIRIGEVQLRDQRITLHLRNLYAMDRVCLWREKHGLDPQAVNRQDFATKVTFIGVSRFAYQTRSASHHPEFHCSQLSKQGNAYKLDIMMVDGARTVQPTTMRIVFKRAEIESIYPRISKYVRGKRIPHLLTWVSRDAKYYLRTEKGWSELIPLGY